MYFEFEGLRPETPSIESAISRREAVLISVGLHLLLFALVVFLPRLPIVRRALEAQAQEAQLRREQQLALQAQRDRESNRFVFVAPRVDIESPKPPDRGELSDKDRMARTMERPPNPTNSLPFSRGNSTERVEGDRSARPPPPTPPQPAGSEGDEHGDRTTGPQAGDGSSASGGASSASLPAGLSGSTAPNTAKNSDGSGARGGGKSLAEALNDLQRYVADETFDNPQGGAGAFGPSIQFDTKGVEFGPWIRRFVAQIKRNWFIPYAAMALKGHVVVTFNVHKDGSISDLRVADPSSVDAFNNSSFSALVRSNPTMPLPPEYPADQAFFTVTFYYNETPP